MKIAVAVLVLTATLALVTGKPQDVSFPEESNGSSDRTPPARPTPTTPATSPAGSTDPGGTTTTVRSTRIPPRDPGNRIVYLVSCPCNFTYQYSPVCGTDGQTYGNVGVLGCARQCGKQVDVYLNGACGSNNG